MVTLQVAQVVMPHKTIFNNGHITQNVANVWKLFCYTMKQQERESSCRTNETKANERSTR